MNPNLVICCDGTGNQFSTSRTNVLRLWRSCARGPDQLVYYDPGVGTMGDPAAITRYRKILRRWLDGAIGLTVRDNVLEAYTFLVHNARPEHRLFLFGFSRGAYTVRALAAMLDIFGLVRPEHANCIPYLWLVFANDEGGKQESDARFGVAGGIRKRMARPAPVHFLGCWDTVASFGWMWNLRTLPSTADVPGVSIIRHAVALDERRAAFRHNLFTPSAGADCVQMLFAGAHADVGGGYPPAESGLAKIAFQWMTQQAAAAGLLIDQSAFDRELSGSKGNQGPDPVGKLHNQLDLLAWRLVELMPRIGFGAPRGVLARLGRALKWLCLVLLLVPVVGVAATLTLAAAQLWHWACPAICPPAPAAWLVATGLVVVPPVVLLLLALVQRGRRRDLAALGTLVGPLQVHPSVAVRMDADPGYRPPLP